MLLLPNGYGVLRYAQSVGSAISSAGARDVVAMNFRGQGASDGVLDIAGCAADLRTVLDWVGAPAQLLVHCSAMLPLLTLKGTDPMWRSVQDAVLYGYLAQPAKHLDRFRRKAERYGVRFSEAVEQSGEFTVDRYAEIPVPLSLVHPQISENLRRASLDEVELLSRVGRLVQTRTPAEGYAIDDMPQESLVYGVCQSEILPLLEAGSGRTETA
ncbi:MAG: hypothetical protein IT431_11765 [Phycisphaerales bacterium]|nr:hypothetical protein [Phycisphaerales bacterium]